MSEGLYFHFQTSHTITTAKPGPLNMYLAIVGLDLPSSSSGTISYIGTPHEGFQ